MICFDLIIQKHDVEGMLSTISWLLKSDVSRLGHLLLGRTRLNQFPSIVIWDTINLRGSYMRIQGMQQVEFWKMIDFPPNIRAGLATPFEFCEYMKLKIWIAPDLNKQIPNQTRRAWNGIPNWCIQFYFTWTSLLN